MFTRRGILGTVAALMSTAALPKSVIQQAADPKPLDPMFANTWYETNVSVSLPPSLVGSQFTIMNTSKSPISVYGTKDVAAFVLKPEAAAAFINVDGYRAASFDSDR